MTIDPTKCTFDNPHCLEAGKRQQGGYDIYTGDCPRCGTTLALNMPGRHPCGCCGLWLKLNHPDEEKILAQTN